MAGTHPLGGQTTLRWRIRAAAPEEAPALAALVNEAYRVEEFFVAGGRTSPGELQSLIERRALLVAEDPTGAIGGTVQVEVDGERGYFGMLAVDPRLQGGGLGRQLVAAAEAACRRAGCRRLGLAVVNLREELFPWYRRLGFEERGTEPFPERAKLKRPCHFVVMEKALD